MLDRLRAALADEGLHVVRAVDQGALDRAGVDLSLAALLPQARGATIAGIVIGDGGGDFFARFRAAGAAVGAQSDPLDRYTRQVIARVFADVLGAAPFSVRFPFDAEQPPLPVQRLGVAAGLPAAGPLGIQIHPRFGPWWAYRAFVVTDRIRAAPEPALASPCAGCAAPCTEICPAGAVTAAGTDIDACARHRLADAGCATTCRARRACIVGRTEAYGDDQLAFHMAASLASVRRYFARGPRV